MLCDFMEYLAINLKYWSYFANDEELHARNGKLVLFCRSATFRVFPIFEGNLIINTFNKLATIYQFSNSMIFSWINQHPHFIKIDWKFVI